MFLNTAGDILNNAQQAAFESYYTEGGGFVARQRRDRDRARLAVPHRCARRPRGRRAVGRSAGRRSRSPTAATRRASRCRSTGAHATGGTTSRPTCAASRTCWRRSMRARTAAARWAVDHPITWCKDYQGGRSFYTGLGDTPGGFGEAGVRAHLGGAIRWAAGLADPATATAARPCWPTTSRPGRGAAEPQRADRLRRAPRRPRDADRRAAGCGCTTPATKSPLLATDPGVHAQRGRHVRPGGRQRLRHQQVGVPLLLAADGHERQAVRRHDQTTRRRTPMRPTTAASTRASGTRRRATSSCRRFKFVDGPTPTLDLATEQKIMRVPVNRGACCHVAGDIDFDSHNNLWLVTGDDTPAGGGNSGGFSPAQRPCSPTTGCTTRRSSTPAVRAEHQRPARQGAAHPGQRRRHATRARAATCSPAGTAAARRARRSTRWASATRSGSQVDENDVAYITDYSPDSADPGELPRPGRHRARGDRAQAGELRLAAVHVAGAARTTAGTSTPASRWTPRRAPHECDNPTRGPQNTSRWNQRRPDREPARVRAADHPAGDLVLLPRQHPSHAAGHAVPGVLRRLRRHLPAAVPGARTPAASARTARPSTTTTGATRTRRSSRSTTTTRSSSASSRRTRCARSGSTPNKQIFKINNLLDCGDSAPRATPSRSSATTPMDMQFGADGALLPADLRRRVLHAATPTRACTFDYVKGQRAPQAVLERDADQRPGAAHACASPARGRATPTRATRSSSRGTSTATAPSTRSTPTRRTSTPPTASTRPG